MKHCQMKTQKEDLILQDKVKDSHPLQEIELIRLKCIIECTKRRGKEKQQMKILKSSAVALMKKGKL